MGACGGKYSSYFAGRYYQDACTRHDIEYAFADISQLEADLLFYDDMERIRKEKGGGFLRHLQALVFFLLVRLQGHKYYNYGKIKR